MSQSVPTGLKEGYRPILSAGIPRPGAPSLSGRTQGTSSVWSLRVESDLGFPEGKTQPRHSGTLIQSLGATFLVSGDPKRISTNFGGTWPDSRGGRWAQPSPNSETPAEALSRGRSYRSLWQNGASWIPLSSPDMDLQPIELAVKSNHYCHAQKGPDSPWDPKKKQAWRQLCVAAAFCLLFMIGEVIGGYLAHSLAIMTDAAHLLTDFASMLISLFSLWMSSRPATKTMNFGWQRAEILGALLSVLSIWVVTGVLVYLAVERLISGNYEIVGGTMLITSGCAVVVNIIMGFILHQSGHGHGHSHGHGHGHDHGHSDSASQHQENPSVRAAFIHVIGDFLQSLGVLVAAYILYFKPEYKYIDPICTFLFSVLVLGTTLTILRDVIVVLMEGTPKGVDFTAVRDLLLSVEGVEALHNLHIWALTVAQPVLSVHIAIARNTDAQAVLKAASACLQGKFHFHTVTIQIEDYSEDMKDCQSCQGPSA